MVDDFNVFGSADLGLLETGRYSRNGHADETDEAGDSSAGLRPDLLASFGDFIDQRCGAIGRVVGSEREPASGVEFAIWVTNEATTLDTGHIVVAFSEDAAIIGVVDEARRYTDVRGFLDDYIDRLTFDDGVIFQPATKRPEILVFVVRTLATKHLRDDVDSRRPPLGGPVWFATEDAIHYALGTQKYTGFPVPALLHTNGNYSYDATGEIERDEHGRGLFQRTPIMLDADYLMGPEAGHANWTGQSGLATKTSHAIFLIASAFDSVRQENVQRRARGEREKKIAALMFNVKGADLLWLDKPAQPESIHAEAYKAAGAPGLSDRDLAAYDAFGMTPATFANFRIFAPFKPKQEPTGSQSAGRAHQRQQPRDFDDDMERGEGPGLSAASTKPLSIVALDQVPAETLRRSLATGRTAPREAGPIVPVLWGIDRLLKFPHRIFDRFDMDDKILGLVSELRDTHPASAEELLNTLDMAIAHAEEKENGGNWHGHHVMTLRKLKNRIHGMSSKFAGLLSRGQVIQNEAPEPDAPFTDQELRVIDIANANTNVQEVLVANTIQSIWRKAEEQTLAVDHLIIFVDELNKYAPAGSESGLRDTLVDIAARGRHINVVLFGAQQFRSKVEGEILGNCGTSFYGRVGDEEIVNAAYRSLSPQVQSELLGLPKGKLLVRHAHFRTPLFGSFPMPPTLSGTLGQKIFNSENGPPVQHPGDALWQLMRRLMGEHNAPASAEVRSACEGVAPERIDMIYQKVERSFTSGQAPRGNPWRTAASLLSQARQRGSI